MCGLHRPVSVATIADVGKSDSIKRNGERAEHADSRHAARPTRAEWAGTTSGRGTVRGKAGQAREDAGQERGGFLVSLETLARQVRLGTVGHGSAGRTPLCQHVLNLVVVHLTMPGSAAGGRGQKGYKIPAAMQSYSHAAKTKTVCSQSLCRGQTLSPPLSSLKPLARLKNVQRLC